MSQLHDEGIKIIKLKLSQGEAKYKCFHTDHQGILWFNNRIVVPKDHQLRKQILDEAHLSTFSIHPGSTKMYQDLRQNFWWARMKREIAKYVSECDTCQRVKASHLKASGTLQPLPIPLWKWKDISMDFIVGLPNTSQKHDSIWVIIDRLTKTAHFLPVHTTYSAKKYAKVYLDQIVRLHGVPKTIISDRGAQFIARFWEQLQTALGTKLIRSSAYHPRLMDRLSESTKFLKTCSELVLFTMVQAGTNVLPWPSSLTTIAINLVFRWLHLKRYTVKDVELL
jgi:hypothetical protein